MQHSPQRAHGNSLPLTADGSLGAMMGSKGSKGSLKTLSCLRVQEQEHQGIYQTIGKKV